LLGIHLPENAEEIERKTQEGIRKIQKFIAHTPVEEIVSFPVMTDPEKTMAMQLLFQLNPQAIQVNPALFNLSTIMMFELTLDYGTLPFPASLLPIAASFWEPCSQTLRPATGSGKWPSR
jgi:predicted ATPase